MNQLSVNKLTCAELMTMAEQELAAFLRAVTELFGAEQAELSAEDWLQELIAIDGLPASTRELRSITAKVSTRLASQVNASSESQSTFEEENTRVFVTGATGFIGSAIVPGSPSRAAFTRWPDRRLLLKCRPRLLR